ncbi:MAG: NAD(P)-dependent oxidoreductase [Gammaproteobacteria bacterium]|nr:NAD(P)-dependent oxidoreductase [Gammaproteobacteria bacterium]
MSETLKNKVILITGSSRGIGREIALRAAKDGAKIIIAAKTNMPHPKLEGTIHTVAKEVEQAGGEAFPIVLDVRDEESIQEAIQKSVDHFGGIDILVNNASAIFMAPTLDTPAKRFDLMFSVNVRGTFLCSQACLPWLKKSTNPHILNLSPPLNMQAKWFKDYLAYTMSKYGMSMCVLGMAEEFRSTHVAVNALWPKTTIATAAIAVNFPAPILRASRKPSIMADAAHVILTSDSKKVTGNFFIDEDVLKNHGKTDFTEYAMDPNAQLYPDLFL